MGKHFIGKKSNKELEKAQRIFADAGSQYLKQWTKKELSKFRTQPVVIPYGKYGFFVGNFIITGLSRDCWQVSWLDNKHVHDFVSKQSAILYCLYEVSSKFVKADEIRILDEKIGRLTNDMLCYESTLKSSDNFKKTVLLNRYIDAKMQRDSAAKNLKKTLNSAKYLNFGNQVI